MFPPLTPLEFHLSQLCELESLLATNLGAKKSKALNTLSRSDVWIPVGGHYGRDGQWIFSGTSGFFLHKSWLEVNFDVGKAAKADDADIPKFLWNWRIISGFPHHSPVSLEFLRRLIVARSIVRRAFLELKTFLQKKFGVHWCSLLSKARQQRLQQGGEGKKGGHKIRC